MMREGFRAHAVVRRSVFISLGECIKPGAGTARFLPAARL